MASISVYVVLGLLGCVLSYTGHENCDIKGGSHQHVSGRSAATLNKPPYYRGCFDDDDGTILKDYYIASDVMNRDLCFNICWNGNYLYAAVGLGRECTCGNYYDPVASYQVPEDQCDIPCGGNSMEMCGGWGTVNLFQLR